MEEEIRALIKENEKLRLEIQLVSKRKATIRQVNLDRFMRVDSNLNKMVIDTMLEAQKYFKNNHNAGGCSVDDNCIHSVSVYLRIIYQGKEENLAKKYNFKQNKQL